jgi:hypothetical protein
MRVAALAVLFAVSGCMTPGPDGIAYVASAEVMQRLVAAARQCGIERVRAVPFGATGDVTVYIGGLARAGSQRRARQECLFRWVRESGENIGMPVIVT